MSARRMKRPVHVFITLVSVMLLSGCQTWKHVQFVVPASGEASLASALRSVALRRGMRDRTRASKTRGTIVYFSAGDRNFTDLGARKHNDTLIVDLLFRSAGVGGDLFRLLEPEVQQALERLYPGAVRMVRDPKKMVAIPSPIT
jgi:hypothetical protein